MHRNGRAVVALLVAGAWLVLAGQTRAQGQGQAQAPPSPDALSTDIAQLGSFDFPTRTEAARRVRRADRSVVAPLLAQAVQDHPDEYVRFRAFVLLTGIDDAAAGRVAADVLDDHNDRLRTVAYQWFEHHPTPEVLPRLLAALDTELSEFVRPALTRAIAAAGDDPRVRQALLPLVMRGEDLFRGSVIEALGDYHGRYALAEIAKVAMLDGPLQDDAITAIGRIGDRSEMRTLSGLQRSAPRDLQPTIAAAACLLEADCQARVTYLTQTLAFVVANDGYQSLLQGVTHALGVLGAAGRADALTALVDAGVKAPDVPRGPIALGLGLAALRDPAFVIGVLADRPDLPAAGLLLRDAFDTLSDEDFEEERFGVELRREIWAEPEGSPHRRALESLATTLEY